MELRLVVQKDGKVDKTWNLESDSERGIASLAQYAKEAIIDYSTAAIKEELGKGFDPKYTRFVDNDPRKDLKNVLPFGRVDYVAREDLKKVITFIYMKVLNLSPVLTGRYESDNVIFYNNVQVAANAQELQSWLDSGPEFQSKDNIRFVNLAPYARKLERHGVTRYRQKPTERKRHDKRLQGPVLIPNGVYVAVARSANTKYGKNAFIRFALIDGATISNLDSANKNRNYQTKRNHIQSRLGKPYFYPTISVNVIGAAITNGDDSNE